MAALHLAIEKGPKSSNIGRVEKFPAVQERDIRGFQR